MCALRVVFFNNMAPLFDLVSRWAEATGDILSQRGVPETLFAAWVPTFGAASATLQCKTTALNFLSDPRAKATIDGQTWLVERVDLSDEPRVNAAPGTLLQPLPDGALVRAGDGAIKIKGQRLELKSQ